MCIEERPARIFAIRIISDFLQLFDNCPVQPGYHGIMNRAWHIFGMILLLAWFRAGAQEKWSVHEWGTFTSLQDESGNAIGGLNTDDEPVPPFVHQLNAPVLLRSSEVPNNFFKGTPSCHPDVTMRLETPVIYFHPPKSATGIQTASVRVTFHGGWLSEFYPDADLTIPGSGDGRFQFGRLFTYTESALAWNDLKIGGDWPVTDTSARVWTSPRAVESALVQATNGESEKFLFYRGVAHLDAPLRVSHDANSGELLFHGQLEGLPGAEPLPIHSLWLVDIQPGGKIAFRTLSPISLNHDSKKILTHTAADFAPGDFSSANLEKLKGALQSALVSEGLFTDEARALLNTWELSYFKSTGLRVFFLVPRAWTDFYLPLEISRPADINRVMVGRIELVTSRQRNILREISGFSTNEIRQGVLQLYTNYFGRLMFGTVNRTNAQYMAQLNRDMAELYSGEKPLASFISIPKTYQTYLDLGRFRNALVLDAAKACPTEGLTNFIATYRLQAYHPAPTPPSL
jgi:hypothetical protein